MSTERTELAPQSPPPVPYVQSCAYCHAPIVVRELANIDSTHHKICARGSGDTMQWRIDNGYGDSIRLEHGPRPSMTRLKIGFVSERMTDEALANLKFAIEAALLARAAEPEPDEYEKAQLDADDERPIGEA